MRYNLSNLNNWNYQTLMKHNFMKYVKNLIRDQQILIIDNLEKSCYFDNISAFCTGRHDNSLTILKYFQLKQKIIYFLCAVRGLNNSKQIHASRCEYDSIADQHCKIISDQAFMKKTLNIASLQHDYCHYFQCFKPLFSLENNPKLIALGRGLLQGRVSQ